MKIQELAAFCSEKKIEFEVFFQSHILGDNSYQGFMVIIRLPVSFQSDPCATGADKQFELAAQKAYDTAVMWYKGHNVPTPNAKRRKQ